MNVAVIGLVGLRKMGRKTWVDGDGMKKGEWTAEEDQNLVAYINEHGVSDWRSLPKRAGLQRCGKSCRLRWLNYLRPGIKRGKFTPQEEEEIIKLHAVLGNRLVSQLIAASLRKTTALSKTTCFSAEANYFILTFSLYQRSRGPELALMFYVSAITLKRSGQLLPRRWIIEQTTTSRTIGTLIKSILLEPRIASSDQDEKEEVKRDHTIGGGEEGDDFLIWDDEEVRRFMESDEMEYGTTPYVSLFYESTHGRA
ncbi:hypothetical protein HID58_036322 [Brassica napus]|uniref:Uncharacterized protein n=1 Tax=Brassica napus TaxID=3708 RepID=A0ABQ8C7F6_BRANA|nr:hypothetical protein HID58_036322 [Brassica napus]